MTASEPIVVSAEHGVAEIRFNRPQAMNVIDVPMAEAFAAAAASVVGDEAVRVVVLSGEGRAFMAGGDLASFKAAGKAAPQVARAIIGPMNAGLLALSESPKPTIASVHGAVAGAGMSLAMFADLAIAADDARFNLAYVKVATNPDCGGSWRLVQLVGVRRAMEIALLSDPIGAAEALALGLVNRVVPATELREATATLARRLAAGPPRASGQIKRLISQAPTTSLADQLTAELEGFAGCAATEDFHEAIDAFLGKRSPVFTGR